MVGFLGFFFVKGRKPFLFALGYKQQYMGTKETHHLKNSHGFNTEQEGILGRNQGQGTTKRLARAKEQNLQVYLVGESNHGCQLSCVKV